MREKEKKEMYIKVIKDCWREAEDIATTELGVSDNSVISAIFMKICEPYSYWRKKFHH